MTVVPLPRAGVAPALRPAALDDVPSLERLIEPFVAAGDLLPRSNYDLCRHIKEFVVVADPAGESVACGQLKVYSRELGEIAGLAVRADRQGQGLGRAIVEALVEEARRLGLAEVFALTRKPLFFARLGFAPADKAHFPLKVWADCARCPRKECCDEVALSRRL
ncbi:MAG TPA: GNAT family N-acetyltransferase [Gemmatimonadales bacterium]|nr:GNAT family N-acetyltransferase [Gemmatimonadales bacterium]